MRRVRILLLALTLMSASASIAETAQASLWTSIGDTSFGAASGPVTITGPSSTLSCPDGSLSATMSSSSTAGVWYAFSGTITYSFCRIAGVPTQMTCTFDFLATSLAGGVTTGYFDDTSLGCMVWGTSCNIAGSTSGATYTNPGTAGVLAIPTSYGLSIWGSGCILGTGYATRTAQRFTVTGGNVTMRGPVIIHY